MRAYILVMSVLVFGIAGYSQTTASNGIVTTPSNTDLNLRTNSSTANRLTIRNASGSTQGYVGINTASASIAERLHITGNTRTSGNFMSDAGIFNVSNLLNPFVFQTNGIERMRIIGSGTYAGNVGIGTINPLARLHITGTPGTLLRLETGSAPGNAVLEVSNYTVTGVFESVIGSPTQIRSGSLTNYPYSLITNNIDRLTITTDGKVGVGNIAPTYTLDVAGPVNASEFRLNGTVFTGSNWSLASGNISRTSGNVGIGTASPGDRLHVAGGNIIFDNGTTPTLFTGTGSTELGRYFQLANATGLATPAGFKAGGVLIADTYAYANPSKNDLVVKGKVAIGTPTTTSTNGYTLAVNGKIGAHDVQLERNSNAWPDYVFAESYQLPTLAEVERFIKENKHLKDVPSAEEIEKNGYSATGMDAVLLQKVEELTLYILQQQKQIEELRNELKAIKQQ